MALMTILIVILTGIVLLFILAYNKLVSLRNQTENAWSQIDVQLKRRYDLIPNLVESVKGYMKHEKETLTKLTELRSKLISGNMNEKAKANNQFSDALKSIFAVAENYPKLKVYFNRFFFVFINTKIFFLRKIKHSRNNICWKRIYSCI